MPKVSIVLPCYNGEEYLRESIDSVMKQTYQDWELIVVDDCSEDRTLAIAREYEKSDSRIKVIHNEVNLKLPCSLNVGFSNATGDYLSWTSDDNIYYPDAIQKMVEALEQNKKRYCVRADMDIINATGEVVDRFPEFDNVKMIRLNCFGACFLYRRCVLEEIGGYDTDSFGVEDYDYWLRIMARFGDFLSINEPLYQYRRHGGSLSETKKKMVRQQLTKMRLRNLESIIEKLKDKPNQLCGIYLEMRRELVLPEDVVKKFESVMPEIEGIKKYKGGKAIVFGAGVWGERIVRCLKENVFLFADNDKSKIGKTKDKKEIVSYDEMLWRQKDAQIVIAVSIDHVYELMVQLWNSGIKQFVVGQELMWTYEE